MTLDVLATAVTVFQRKTWNKEAVSTDMLEELGIIRDIPMALKEGKFEVHGMGFVQPHDLVITRQPTLWPGKVLDYVDLIASGAEVGAVDITDIVPGGGVWHLNGLHRMVASRLLDVPIEATYWV